MAGTVCKSGTRRNYQTAIRPVKIQLPKFDIFNRWEKVPSQAISDIFTAELDNKIDGKKIKKPY